LVLKGDNKGLREITNQCVSDTNKGRKSKGEKLQE
jgi:hypothetical protein